MVSWFLMLTHNAYVGADVNGDALPDAVVVAKGLDAAGLPASVSVAVGRGDGWEQTARTWFSSNQPVSYNATSSASPSYALADLNDDMQDDLIVYVDGVLLALYVATARMQRVGREDQTKHV